MSKISEILDEFGWYAGRLDSPEKQTILFRWMQAITQEIDRQRSEIDTLAKFLNEHEDHIKTLVDLQGRMIALAEDETNNLNKLIEIVGKK